MNNPGDDAAAAAAHLADRAGRSSLRLRWVYHALAAFGLFALGASVFLNHRLTNIYLDSVNVHQEWVDRLEHVSHLAELAGRLNAPGNEVFSSHDVDAEEAQLREAAAAFNHQLGQVRDGLVGGLSDPDATFLRDRLDEVRGAMARMTAQMLVVFAYFREGELEKAGVHMAEMDRLFAEGTALIASLRERIYEVEEARSVHEVQAAKSLRLYEYLVAGLVLLLVAGATVYGRLLAGQASREAALRERHLHAVRQAEARTRAIFDAVPDGVLILDGKGRVESANLAAPRLFGYTAEELLGRELDSLAVETAAGPGDALGASRRGRADGELRGRRKDGSTFPLEWSAAPVRLASAEMLAVVVRDISARRRAEEDHRRLQARLQYAQQMEVMAGLSGGIAHYFNTLLMTVSSGTALARHELPPDSPTRHTLLQVEEAALRGAEVTRQLLAYTGQAELSVTRVDLGRLVADMAPGLQGSAKAGVAIEVMPADYPCPVQIDPTQVQRVLLNLFANAVEAIGAQGGRVEVHTGQMFAGRDYLHEPHLPADLPAGEYAYVEVRDNGAGMDARTRRQIFHPFYSTKFLGRGLGLALVLGIVRAHRGAIKVFSEPGSGTSVRVLFPIPQTSAVEGAEVVPLRASQRSGLGTRRRTAGSQSA